MASLIKAVVTEQDLEQLPLTEVAERLIYDEAALNAVCGKMLDAVAAILQRDLHQDDAWTQAEAELTPQQRLAVWHEAVASIS